MTRTSIAVLALILLISGAAAPLLPAPAKHTSTPVAAQAFEVDLAHSMIIFKIRHFGVSNFYGRINMPQGTFLIDPDNLASSSLEITVDIKHMDAGNEQRDRFLLAPDFFNVREYPTATFSATSVRRVDENTFEATGDFTLHGVTRRITARLEQYTERDTSKFGYRAGFEARFTINRGDFGIDKMLEGDLLGDEVEIIANIEGVRR